MAKIYLRARRPIEVDNETAKKIKREWLNKDLPDMVDVGSDIFKSQDIRGIEGIYDKQNGKNGGYDLDNPSHKSIIKQFEKDFLDWLDKSPEYQNKPFSFFEWSESLGAIKINEQNIETIVDIVLYEELNKKWSALQDLRNRRVMAKKSENESLENLSLNNE